MPACPMLRTKVLICEAPWGGNPSPLIHEAIELAKRHKCQVRFRHGKKNIRVEGKSNATLLLRAYRDAGEGDTVGP